MAIRELREAFSAVRVSTIHWTKPLGGLDQPRYANGVVAAQTNRPTADVKAVLRAIEAKAGRERVREHSHASRTLDLDLLTYGDLVIPELGLPDNDLVERDFVLIPAAELAPDYVHPLRGQTLSALATALFPVPQHMLGPVDFPLEG
jgi:2-amino-4-hydroxy-6-hydroxymethyldihydropteridine diphosphokinase